MQNHGEIGVAEEGVDAHEVVVDPVALAGDLVALGAQITLAGAVVDAVDGVHVGVMGARGHRAVLTGAGHCGRQRTPIPVISGLSGRTGRARVGRKAHERRGSVSPVERIASRIRELDRLVAELAHVERVIEEAAGVEAEIAVEQPLETERVEVFLRDLHKARLDLDQAGRDVEVFQHLLEHSELLGRVGDAQLADGGKVRDRGAVRPLHAHLLEEDLPVLFLSHVGRLHEGRVAAALRAHLAGGCRHALGQRREHVVGAGHQLGVRFVGRNNHDDVAADLELHAGDVADQLEGVVEVDEAGAQRRDGRYAALCRARGCRRERIGVFGGGRSRRRAGVQLEHQIHAALFHRDFRLVVIAAGLLEEIDGVNDGGGRAERDLRDHDVAQLLLDDLLGGLRTQRIDGRLFARDVSAARRALRAVDGVAARRPRRAHLMDHLAARGFEFDIRDGLHAVGDAVAQLHGFHVVGVVAQDQLALLQRLVILGGGVVLARTAQTAADLITLRLVLFLIDTVRNTGGVGFGLGRLTLQRFDQALGLRMAIFLGLRGQRQRLLCVSDLHRLLGIQIEGFRHARFGFIARGLRGGTVADELKGLFVLFTGQRIVAGRQSLSRGLQGGEAVTVERLAADRLQRHQLRDQAGGVTRIRHGRRVVGGGGGFRFGLRFCDGRGCGRRLYGGCGRRSGFLFGFRFCGGRGGRGRCGLGSGGGRRSGFLFGFHFCGGRRRRFYRLGLRFGRLGGGRCGLYGCRFLLTAQILQQRFEIILRVQAGHGPASHGRSTQHQQPPCTMRHLERLLFVAASNPE